MNSALVGGANYLAACFAGLAQRGEQEADENCDDCYDNEEFDEREGGCTRACA